MASVAGTVAGDASSILHAVQKVQQNGFLTLTCNVSGAVLFEAEAEKTVCLCLVVRMQDRIIII
jgi:hypothetical protein